MFEQNKTTSTNNPAPETSKPESLSELGIANHTSNPFSNNSFSRAKSVATKTTAQEPEKTSDKSTFFNTLKDKIHSVGTFIRQHKLLTASSVGAISILAGGAYYAAETVTTFNQLLEIANQAGTTVGKIDNGAQPAAFTTSLWIAATSLFALGSVVASTAIAANKPPSVTKQNTATGNSTETFLPQYTAIYPTTSGFVLAFKDGKFYETRNSESLKDHLLGIVGGEAIPFIDQTGQKRYLFTAIEKEEPREYTILGQGTNSGKGSVAAYEAAKENPSVLILKETVYTDGPALTATTKDEDLSGVTAAIRNLFGSESETTSEEGSTAASSLITPEISALFNSDNSATQNSSIPRPATPLETSAAKVPKTQPITKKASSLITYQQKRDHEFRMEKTGLQLKISTLNSSLASKELSLKRLKASLLEVKRTVDQTSQKIAEIDNQVAKKNQGISTAIANKIASKGSSLTELFNIDTDPLLSSVRDLDVSSLKNLLEKEKSSQSDFFSYIKSTTKSLRTTTVLLSARLNIGSGEIEKLTNTFCEALNAMGETSLAYSSRKVLTAEFSIQEVKRFKEERMRINALGDDWSPENETKISAADAAKLLKDSWADNRFQGGVDSKKTALEKKLQERIKAQTTIEAKITNFEKEIFEVFSEREQAFTKLSKLVAKEQNRLAYEASKKEKRDAKAKQEQEKTASLLKEISSKIPLKQAISVDPVLFDNSAMINKLVEAALPKETQPKQPVVSGAEIIATHRPINPETKGLINQIEQITSQKQVFMAMQPLAEVFENALLINSASSNPNLIQIDRLAESLVKGISKDLKSNAPIWYAMLTELVVHLDNDQVLDQINRAFIEAKLDVRFAN